LPPTLAAFRARVRSQVSNATASLGRWLAAPGDLGEAMRLLGA